jgi:hypothetical protein
MSENTNNENELLETLIEDSSNEKEESIKDEAPVVAEVVDENPEAIVLPKPKEEKPGLGYIENGVMASTVVPKTLEKKPAVATKKTAKKDIVAVHSTRNVTWNGVGKVYIGYNIVSKEAADQWVTRDHIRLATPEEVAREYGQ